MTRHENDHLEGHGMLWKRSGEAFNIVECSDADLSRLDVCYQEYAL